MENYYDYIVNYLVGLSEDDLLDLWNNYYCEENMDSYIYYNDEYFFEEYFTDNVNEAVRAVYYGNYNYMDAYVIFNGYGNLDTSNYLDDFIYLSDLASYLEDNGFLKDEYLDYIEENQEV